MSELHLVSDIYVMELLTTQTKQCPFCAETIQAQAIKCRFCGEFLNSRKARALENRPAPGSGQNEDSEQDEKLLFIGRPSLLGMSGTVIRGLFFLAIAAFLITYPLEKLQWFEFTENYASFISKYRFIAGLGLAILVVLTIFLKALKLKMTYYEVSSERIEWSRGILDRRVDNLDMFRVIDLKLRRSLLDCIFGIGTVSLVTTDKSDPKFVFEKVRNCRDLYDVIKKASLDADRRTGVVHLE